ncbi:MAG: hypothetical protein P4L87_25665 [Formivibrio sp.]|nr:hypothetical protein [Formivibrio sp.]
MEFWDALTGLGTLALAIATFIVIKQTVAVRKDDERHHQEQFRPVCVLVRPSFSDPRSPGNQIIINNPNSKINHDKGLLHLTPSLRNIGSGPALNLRISVRLLDMDGLRLKQYELPPLAPKETMYQDTRLAIPIELSEKFNPTDFASMEGQRWEIILEYEDVFGNSFHSIHRKPPAEPWVSVHTGRYT